MSAGSRCCAALPSMTVSLSNQYFWEVTMEIKRDSYLASLISKKNNGLTKVITGLRRCGKSYLLFTLFKNHLLAEGTDSSHILEMNF